VAVAAGNSVGLAQATNIDTNNNTIKRFNIIALSLTTPSAALRSSRR
jgi:hypothetical protein